MARQAVWPFVAATMGSILAYITLSDALFSFGAPFNTARVGHTLKNKILCTCVHCIYIYIHEGDEVGQKGIGSPRTGLKNCCEPMCGC